MLITAAGILTELTIAAVCTCSWLAAPGTVRSVLLNTMVLCSVNTLIFNGNPLLRYDGYFLLTDFLRIPNLAGRSAAALRTLVLNSITGDPGESHEPPRTQTILLSYGILSLAYRTILTIAIVRLILQISETWHVRFLGQALTVILLTGTFLFPMVHLLKSATETPGITSSRGIVRSVAFLSLLAAVLFWPLPHSILVPAIVQPTGQPVYAQLPGYLTSTTGYQTRIRNDDVLLQLHSPELRETEAELQGQVAEWTARLDAARRSSDGAQLDHLPVLKQSLAAAEQRLQQFQDEARAMTVLSPGSGILLPPTARTPPADSDLPEFWQQLPLDSVNRQAWIQRGTLLGYVGEVSDQVIECCVPQHQIDFIRPDSAATFLQQSGGASPNSAVVTLVSSLSAPELPRHLAAGMLISGRETPTGIIPAEPTWIVALKLNPSPPGGVPLYAVGSARITTRPISIFGRVLRSLRQTFSR
ncbi:MAG: hypothetical protein R3C49_21680 [Planctomycetaceae bacterium]